MKYFPLRRLGLGLAVVAGAMMPLTAVSAETPMWSYDDHAFYDNLKILQAEARMTDRARGAQGPVRTDYMESTWSYDDNAFYDNLKKLQSSTSTSDSAMPMHGAQGAGSN